MVCSTLVRLIIGCRESNALGDEHVVDRVALPVHLIRLSRTLPLSILILIGRMSIFDAASGYLFCSFWFFRIELLCAGE